MERAHNSKQRSLVDRHQHGPAARGRDALAVAAELDRPESDESRGKIFGYYNQRAHGIERNYSPAKRSLKVNLNNSSAKGEAMS